MVECAKHEVKASGMTGPCPYCEGEAAETKRQREDAELKTRLLNINIALDKLEEAGRQVASATQQLSHFRPPDTVQDHLDDAALMLKRTARQVGTWRALCASQVKP